MSLSIFKASFEESRRIVTDKYIEHVLGETSTKMINKRMWLGFILVIFTLLFSALVDISDFTDSQSIFFVLVKLSSLNVVWISWSILIATYYLFRNIQSKKRRMLNEYYTSQFVVLVLITALVQMYPLFMFASVEMTGISNIPIIGVLFSIVLYVQLAISSINVIKIRLYTENYKADRFLELLKTSIEILTKFGGILLVLITIYRVFTIDQEGLLDTIELYLIIAAPLLMPLITGFVIKWLFEGAVLPGYYLKKYYEEYREEFGFTEEEWNIGYGTDEE